MHFLFLKTDNSNMLCLKNYHHNLTKYEVNGTWKISISQLFCEMGKFWKCNIRLFSKNQFFHLFHELKYKIFLWIGKNFEVQPNTSTQKNSNFESMDELGKVMS